MSKNFILVWVVIFFFFSGNFVFASLSINEIMYDLSGSDSTSSKSREWIEIYNPDSNEVLIDASKWRIYDGSANRTINGEVNFSIPANSYVIFAGDKDTFLADHTGFSGVVYDSGITSLNNAGDILKILDQDGNVVDTVTYASSQGGAGDGNSLQKISSVWVGAIPTPGAINETATTPPTLNPPPSTGGSSSSSVSNSAVIEKPKVVEIPKIKTQITSKTLGFVGLPISFPITALGYSGEKLNYGKYFINFGDGDSKEIKLIDSSPISHSYFYPGEYTVSLDYFLNYYSDISDASSQINIKIIGADISISNVGDEKDFFIELTNNTDYNADLSNWLLISDYKSFTIPKNTILASKKKIIISPKITQFSIEDKNNLKLMTMQREVVFDYPSSVTPIITTKTITIQPKISTVVKPLEVFSSVPEKKVPEENLQASVLASNISEKNIGNSIPIIPIVSVIFIGASSYAVYFIRQKKIVSKTGDDFEILDE